MALRSVSLRLEPELWDRVARAARLLGQSQTTFVRRALEQALAGGEAGGPSAAVRPGGGRSVGLASARASVPGEDVVEYEPRAVVRVDGADLPRGPVFVPREPETFRVTQEGLRRSAGHHPACKCPVCRPSVGAP